MADTTFVDSVTRTAVEWFQDLNDFYYDTLNSPASAAEVRTALSLSGNVIQCVEATPYTTQGGIATAIPLDNTIPQNTEGTEILTAAITPTLATSNLVIEANVWGGGSGAVHVIVALFVDTTADALNATATAVGTSLARGINLQHVVAAGSTTARTYKIRVGPESGTFFPNSNSTTDIFGGVAACRMRVWEIAS